MESQYISLYGFVYDFCLKIIFMLTREVTVVKSQIRTVSQIQGCMPTLDDTGPHFFLARKLRGQLTVETELVISF